MYKSPHGKLEGLHDRISEWIKRMSNDHSLPWAGLGIIEDLKATLDYIPHAPNRQDYDL